MQNLDVITVGEAVFGPCAAGDDLGVDGDRYALGRSGVALHELRDGGRAIDVPAGAVERDPHAPFPFAFSEATLAGSNGATTSGSGSPSKRAEIASAVTGERSTP